VIPGIGGVIADALSFCLPIGRIFELVDGAIFVKAYITPRNQKPK